MSVIPFHPQPINPDPQQLRILDDELANARDDLREVAGRIIEVATINSNLTCHLHNIASLIIQIAEIQIAGPLAMNWQSLNKLPTKPIGGAA